MTTKLRAASFQDNAVTTAKIAADAITNAKIADDAVQTENVASTVNLGRRNIIINGAMQVAQRGTSFTSVAGSAYHLDRFRTGMGDTTARFTVTQATAALNGFANSLKYDCTTAESSLSNADARLFIQHRLEGQDLQQLKKGTSDAEKVTVSFYVKTNKSGVYTVELYDNDNTRSISQTITVSDANWNRYTLTFDGDTTGTLGNDNGNSFNLIIHLIAGTNYTGGTFSTSWSSATDNTRVSSSNVNIGDSTDNNFEITGVQLEVGSQATSFEHRSFGEELALCQRYYQVKNGSYHPGNAVGSNKINAGFTFPVSFRATPSTPPNVSVHRSGNQTVTASIDSVVCSGDRSSGSIRFVGHTVSDETAYNVYMSGNLELDAEL